MNLKFESSWSNHGCLIRSPFVMVINFLTYCYALKRSHSFELAVFSFKFSYYLFITWILSLWLSEAKLGVIVFLCVFRS